MVGANPCGRQVQNLPMYHAEILEEPMGFPFQPKNVIIQVSLNHSDHPMKLKTTDEIIRQYKSGFKDFKGVTVEDGAFSKLRLVGIILEGAALMNCNFEESILQRASFKAANLRGAKFRRANLAKANLNGADCRGADLRAVDLSGADLRWANLEGVNLTGSIISGANFDGANLKNACLKATDPGKLWWKANLDQAKLDNTILPDGTVFSQTTVIKTE
jgi:uncharacterized protein YjbI with pentapeptide repeats